MSTHIDTKSCRDYAVASRLEWLLANGIGGYVMGTVAGSNTRRYHGLLVAATRPPATRTVLLSSVETYALVQGQSYGVSTNQYIGTVHPHGYSLTESFRADDTAVEWLFKLGDCHLTRSVSIHKGANACTLRHTNLSDETVVLTLRPLVCHKFYHDNFRVTDFYPQFLVFPEERTVLSHNDVRLSLEHPFADRTPTTGWYYRFEHSREAERGLDPIVDLYCPCELRYTLGPGDTCALVASTQEGTAPATPPVWNPAQDTLRERLVAATSCYLVETQDRASVIAGYPWFTDWGRDTMISLPGLCLETGRTDLAKRILRAYAGAMEGGLIPNRFPDDGGQPEYNTADATLWFCNAVHATLESEWDEAFAEEAFAWFIEIFRSHVAGTRYGIGADPQDGLLRQGAPGVQLTWMDAKVGEWVVTPRHGKPVEVNGLWINAMRVMQHLREKTPTAAWPTDLPLDEWAEKAETGFRKKFWKAPVGHYLDTVEPDDATLRPNQLVAMSLPFGPANGAEARRALDRIEEELLTPNGVRTLGPHEPGYHPHYVGTLAERDAAYHQGTAWPWLAGQFAMAVLRVTGDGERARRAIQGAETWLQEYGLGGIAEVYDAEAPQRPGGCPWQAWSVAETLRALVAIEKSEHREP